VARYPNAHYINLSKTSSMRGEPSHGRWHYTVGVAVRCSMARSSTGSSSGSDACWPNSIAGSCTGTVGSTPVR